MIVHFSLLTAVLFKIQLNKSREEKNSVSSLYKHIFQRLISMNTVFKIISCELIVSSLITLMSSVSKGNTSVD